MSPFSIALAAIIAAAALVPHHHAAAHGPSHGASATQVETPFGRTGDPRRVARTVDIRMSDDMRFTPARLAVREGETVRLRVRNTGRVMHELVLGTREELDAHAELMRKHPGMEHDEPYMAHVAPGARGEIVWQFTRAGEFHYGCLVPGHFEAGMRGRITVLAKGESGR
jgi:uncharacterized cupredoxin-like copper-binding protein